MTEGLWKTRKAADYLGMSLDTVYYFVSTKQIPHIKLGGRLRFKKDQLDKWIESKQVEVV